MNGTTTATDLRPTSAAPAQISRASAAFASVALTLAYVFIWLVRRHYGGLDDDAQLYAFQAMARMNPDLAEHDLFLKFGSQDDYTLFTPLFALLIRILGLATAGSLLGALFHAWSAIAAWFIARRFVSRELSWLIAGVVLVMPGDYGPLGVFQYSETFLTARLPAEALTLTALALALASRNILSILCGLLAFLMHPLVTAPGVLAWLLFRFPSLLQPKWILRALGLLAALIILGFLIPIPRLSPMDSEWLAVVGERSFFMFAQNWRPADWDLNILPLLTLGIAFFATSRSDLRRFCQACIAVGVTGLFLTLTNSFVSPTEIIVQGQPWRWTWLPMYIAVIVGAIAAIICWQSGDRILRPAALLLGSAWVPHLAWAFPAPISCVLAGAALVLVWRPNLVPARYQPHLMTLALGTAITLLVALILSISALLQLEFTTNRESFILERTRDVLALTVPAILLVAIAWHATVRSSRLIASTLVCVVASFLLATIVPRTYARWTNWTYMEGYDALANWRAAIDHRRSVFWPGDPIAIWLLLESPGYLSVAQTAGVVFSRETALEAARRAENLEPLTGHRGFGIHRIDKRKSGPLTLSNFKLICRDPELGYVVSSVTLELPYIASQDKRRSNLKLYACDSVRPHAP